MSAAHTRSDPRRDRPDHRAAAGFTLVELVVVMGLLSAFLLMLTQLLNSGVSLFDEGETSQELADRSQAAVRKTSQVFEELTGPAFDDPEPRDPDGRLLIQPVRLGLSKEPMATVVPLVRAEISLSAADERELLLPRLRAALADTLPTDPHEAADVLAAALDEEPLVGRGRMWLMPWPQEGGDGAYLQLRRLRFTQGELLSLADPQDPAGSGIEDWVDPREVDEPGELPAAPVLAASEVIAEDLLHFEVLCWSQFTASWDARGEQRAEHGWDSARAGLLVEADGPWDFSLDLGVASRRDPVDDVWPRLLRVVLVVGHNPTLPPEARLAVPLGPDDTEARLIHDDDLRIGDGGMLKIGAEWVKVGEARGTRLRALQRGQRGTRRQAHDTGAGVRAGRTVVLDLPLAFGKDAWNG